MVDTKQPIVSKEGYDHTLDHIIEQGFEFTIDQNDFYNSARQAMVDYILHRAEVNDTSNQQEWDPQYLPNLALRINRFTGFGDNLKQVIQGSQEGKLIKHLQKQPEYAEYTNSVYDDMKHLNINTKKWLDDKRTMSIGQLTFEPWTRDFRKEYAIGSYSKCCIGLADYSDYNYPGVLLEYFLDPAIKTLKISHEESGQFAQAYLVALKNNTDQPILGVTTIEHDLDKTQANFLIEPLILSIVSKNGFQNQYGFENTIFYARKKEFENYRTLIKNNIEDKNKTIKSYASRKRDMRRTAKQKGDLRKKRILKSSLNRANQVLDIRTQMLENLTAKTHNLSRLGEIKNSVWNGTNYLDIAGGFYSEEGHYYGKNMPLQGYSFTPRMLKKHR